MTTKPLTIISFVLQKDKGSSQQMRKGHSSTQNEKRMTLGLHARHFLTLFLSLRKY